MPEEALVHIFGEARRTTPSILYLPQFQLWWETVSRQVVIACSINNLGGIIGSCSSTNVQFAESLGNVLSLGIMAWKVMIAVTDGFTLDGDNRKSPRLQYPNSLFCAQ